MITSIKFNVDKRQKRAVERSLAHIKNGAGKALVKAVNHTVNKTKTEVGKAIRKEVNLPAAYVRRSLKVKRATLKNTSGSIKAPRRGSTMTRYWQPEGQDTNIDLDKVSFFKAPEAPDAGPRVQIKPKGAVHRMEGAFFIGPMPNSGAILMVKRTLHGPGLGRSKGLQTIYGPSLSQVFNTLKDDLTTPQSEHFNNRLMIEAQKLLQGQ